MQTPLSALGSLARANAFCPGDVWPDTDGVAINAHGGGLLHYGGVYYWYGEHKIAGSVGNTAQIGVGCYASVDLTNWQNGGTALAVSDTPGHDIERGCIIERPKVLFNARTDTFVMWFHLERLGQGYASARVGVATSPSPTGPFTFRRSFRPDGAMSRDMTLFGDEDGAAYLFCASDENQTLHISCLTDDYLDTTGAWREAFVGRYMEAPAVFKYAGRYWFVGSGCTGWEPNAARSAVADTPLGPWQELANPCVGPGADKTFGSQSTFVLPVAGKPGAFIFCADRWQPDNPIDGRYVWLPITFTPTGFEICWRDTWSLADFEALSMA